VVLPVVLPVVGFAVEGLLVAAGLLVALAAAVVEVVFLLRRRLKALA
jgi:hypothetical protein